MSSIAGRFGYPDRIAYATTKWGLVGFTKTLSLELGPHGITANTIHPGAVEGPRIERVMQGRAAVSGRTVEEETEVALTNQAIGRFVDPADIAALAVFLGAARSLALRAGVSDRRGLQGGPVRPAGVGGAAEVPGRPRVRGRSAGSPPEHRWTGH